MLSAFVTGGTGFVGFNLIEQLLSESWEVTALHRPESNLKHLQQKDVHLVEGSITEPDSLIAAIPKKVDAVFHVAGNTNMWSRRNQIQTRDNVEGTGNMVAAALKCGAGRFIHTSSTSAYGHHRHRFDESHPSNAMHSPINYYRTKYLAEMEVRKGIEVGLDAVMLNPANIIGPYDYHNWSQFFTLINRGKLPGLPTAIQGFCHVRDVAKAHVTAFQRGRKGENYLLGGVEVDFLTLAKEIGELLGKKTLPKPMPGWVLKLIGRILLWGSCITGKEPDITPEKAIFVSTNEFCNSQKAEKELNYHQTSLKRMLEDCYQWMLSEGLIDK